MLSKIVHMLKFIGPTSFNYKFNRETWGLKNLLVNEPFTVYNHELCRNIKEDRYMKCLFGLKLDE